MDLAEARIKAPRTVALRKGTYRDGLQAMSIQKSRKAFPFQPTVELALWTLEGCIRRRSAMSYDTAVNTEPTCHQCCARRQTRCVGTKEISESHALASDAVDVRRRIPVIAITAEMVRAQSIDVKIENSHIFSNRI